MYTLYIMASFNGRIHRRKCVVFRSLGRKRRRARTESTSTSVRFTTTIERSSAQRPMSFRDSESRKNECPASARKTSFGCKPRSDILGSRFVLSIYSRATKGETTSLRSNSRADANSDKPSSVIRPANARRPECPIIIQ